MLQSMGFENSTVGVKLMFSSFLSLQDEAKSSKPKCGRSTGLKLYVKYVVRISKIRSPARVCYLQQVSMSAKCHSGGPMLKYSSACNVLGVAVQMQFGIPGTGISEVISCC